MTMPREHKQKWLLALYGSYKLLLAFCAGLGLIIGGLLESPTYSLGNANSGAVRLLGPHGNAIAGIILGALLCLFSAGLIWRAIRRLRAELAQDRRGASEPTPAGRNPRWD